MKLKKECIGMRIKVKDMPVIIIEDNKEKFPLYKSLGLDVFEKRKKASNDKANEGHNE